MSYPGALLLLAPSRGFGGGIERVADAIEQVWDHRVIRVELYRRDRTAVAAGQPAVKAGFAFRAIRAAVESRPETVLSLHVGLAPVAFAAAELVGARTALWGHGLEVWGTQPRWRRTLAGKSSRFLASSSFTAAWMARRLEVDQRQISVLPLAVSGPFAVAAREETSVPDRSNGLTILTVCRIASMDRYKGYFAVAEALPEVLKTRPGIRWVVVGDGDDAGRLRSRCHALGLADRVEFRGSVPEFDLVKAYREADLFVLPSVADADSVPPFGEGFGLVYAEAGSFGIPSLVSAEGGGALEFVEDGVTGVTVPPHDCRALATAICRLLDDSSTRARLGAAAKERVRTHHLPEHLAAALHEALS